LIADHFGWFRDTSVTIETLLKERGQEVKFANGVVEIDDEKERKLVDAALKSS